MSAFRSRTGSLVCWVALNAIICSFFPAPIHGQDALSVLLERRRSEPSNADLCQQIGIAYTRLGSFAEAEKFYREAVRLSPRFWAAHKNLGTVLWFLDRKDESEREFLALAKVLPADPKSKLFAFHKLRYAKEHLGQLPMIEIGETRILEYQTARLKEKGSAKSINEEVALVLRLLGDRGEAIRVKLRRNKVLKLKVSATPGKVFSNSDQDRMLAAARESTMAARREMTRRRRGEKTPKGERQGGSVNIYPCLVLALNAGMRDAEIRRLSWGQVDFGKRVLTVGESKTQAGEGRTIPLNGAVLSALNEHRQWYLEQFGEPQQEWYVFPGGGRRPKDPTVAITTLKTAWTTVRRDARVDGRWHDNRHTLITELAESGAGDGTIMEIAGHVSSQMLARYSHIRMEAKRSALEEIQSRREKGKAKEQSVSPSLLKSTSGIEAGAIQ